MSFFTRKRKSNQNDRPDSQDDANEQLQDEEEFLRGPAETVDDTEYEVVNSDDKRRLNVHEQHRTVSGHEDYRPLERSIIDSLIANICLVDREGVITSVNSAWSKFARENGYVPEQKNPPTYGVGLNYIAVCEEAYGKNVSAAREVAEGLQKVLDGDLDRFSIEYPCHAPDELRWYLLTISPLGPNIDGAIISHFNITEQTQLRQANEELDAFAQSLALNFRTPLRMMTESIEAFAEMFESLDPDLQPHVHHLVVNARRLDSMISDLLAYSRVRRSSTNVRPVDLRNVLDLAVARMSGRIERTRSNVAIEGDFPRVMADEELLVDAIVCILSNAVKFVESDEVPDIRIYSQTTDDAVWLWVEDSGIGIDPMDTTKVFKIFERSEDADGYPGNGIGLAIVERSIKQMGGSVEALPREGKGSRFKLIFPKRKKRTTWNLG